MPGDRGEVPELYARQVTGQLNRMLAEVRSVETRYFTLMEHAHDAITVLDPHGVIVEVNRAAERLLGSSRDAMVGRHLRDFSAPGQEDENQARYLRILNAGAGTVETVLVKRADGALIDLEVSCSRVELDGQPMVFTVSRDVTQSLIAQRRLETSEAKYRALIENIPEVVRIASLDGKTTFVSANVVGLTGYQVAEIEAADADFWQSRVSLEDAPRVEAAYRALSQEQRPFDIEYRWQRKDNTTVWIHERVVVTHHDGVAAAEGLLSDVSGRKSLEGQMRQAQRMEAIGQLTGGVAHDFNNILATILSNSHFLLTDLAPGDPRREDAQEIKLAAERAAALTRQLLAFSRRQILEPSVIDLNGVVSGLEKMLRRLIGEDIDFTVAPASQHDAVLADPGQLEQVIMNLVVNARDAMPSGGKLTLETANVTRSAAELVGQEPAAPGRYVRLSVTDTGCGMDAETRQRAFEPFFTTKEKGKGTGLGLSTCYGIVKQSGGHIELRSEPGHGTTFEIYLPVLEGQRAPQTAAPAPAPRELRGSETILHVRLHRSLRAARRCAPARPLLHPEAFTPESLARSVRDVLDR